MHSYLVLAISWGNKMNFSLYVKMSGFVQIVTYTAQGENRVANNSYYS